jgi:hypothetical protein
MAKTKKIRTKKYTMALLLTEVQALPRTNNPATIINALSPRLGLKSAKISVLSNFLHDHLFEVLDGSDLMARGATARTRLINALKDRRAFGVF